MSPDFWAIITVGIAILIAIATSNRSLRREMSERITGVQRELGGRIDRLSGRVDALTERINAVQRELGERIDRLGGRVDALTERINVVQRELGGRIDALTERINAVQRELGERIDRLSKRIDALGERVGDVRERLGRVEGLLEGFGLTRRKRAGQGRDDEKHGPALPRS